MQVGEGAAEGSAAGDKMFENEKMAGGGNSFGESPEGKAGVE